MRSALFVACLSLSFATPTHAQVSSFTAMTQARLHEVETRVANVHAATGTEADFTEVWLNGMPTTWRGHESRPAPAAVSY